MFDCCTEFVAFQFARENDLTNGLAVARSDPRWPCWIVGTPEELRKLCPTGYRPAKPGETTEHPVYGPTRNIVGYAREVGL